MSAADCVVALQVLADMNMWTGAFIGVVGFLLGYTTNLGCAWVEAHAERVAERVDAARIAAAVDRRS